MRFRMTVIGAVSWILGCANPVGLFPASSLTEVRIRDHRDESALHTVSGADAIWIYEAVGGCSPWRTPVFLGSPADFTLEFVSDKPLTPAVVFVLEGSVLRLSSSRDPRYCVLDSERADKLAALLARVTGRAQSQAPGAPPPDPRS